jgi:hypothetical protein
MLMSQVVQFSNVYFMWQTVSKNMYVIYKNSAGKAARIFI